MDKYLKNHNIQLHDIINDKEALIELTNILNKNFGFSLRKIAEKLDINRETLRNLVNDKLSIESVPTDNSLRKVQKCTIIVKQL